MKFAVFTEYEKTSIEQNRTLLFLSGILLFCPTKILRLSDSCSAISQKNSRGLSMMEGTVIKSCYKSRNAKNKTLAVRTTVVSIMLIIGMTVVLMMLLIHVLGLVRFFHFQSLS